MKALKNKKSIKRARLHKKVRTKISGTSAIPRLSVFRSSRFIYAQLIDDVSAKTILSASDIAMKGAKATRAKMVGAKLAESAKEKKIVSVVFDRGGFSYAGRIKALAEGAREGGLKF
ncbi:MAG: 50S ribosomal protein L18 [Candidatus Paceibacterota bacterium]|jgi:large subunit ribosomal protein L18